MYISNDVIQNIQQKANIVDYISQYVDLKKSGNDYTGLCPFHQEKTPSFHVSPEKQVFHCFGCGKKGNIFQFEQAYQQEDFPTAVQKIADFIHEPLVLETQGYTKEKQTDTKFLQINQKVAEFYHYILLHTKEGEPARKYLQARGISKETMEHFTLGYAPAQREESILRSVLQDELQQESDYEMSGLFHFDRQGHCHDRFFERLMIPLSDAYGRIVGFSGRLLTKEKKEAKYLNTKETSFFKKGNLLFHYDEVKRSDQRQPLLLMEGYMDVMQAWQQGLSSALAGMGTSLTEEQIQKIVQLKRPLILCYDGDEAGLKASWKASQALWGRVQEIKVALFPKGQDPDEYLREIGKASFVQFITKASLTVPQFILFYLRQNKNFAQEEDKAQYIDQVLFYFAQHLDELQASFYLQELSQEFHLEESLLKKRFQQYQQEAKQKESVENASLKVYNKVARLPLQKETLSLTTKEAWRQKNKNQSLQILLKLAFYSSEVRQFLSAEQFYFMENPQYAELYSLICLFFQQHEAAVDADLFCTAYLPNSSLQQLFQEVLAQPLGKGDVAEAKAYLQNLQRLALEETLEQKQAEMQVAQKIGDKAQMQLLSSEIICLLQKR